MIFFCYAAYTCPWQLLKQYCSVRAFQLIFGYKTDFDWTVSPYVCIRRRNIYFICICPLVREWNIVLPKLL